MTTAEPQDIENSTVTALSREGYDLEILDSVPHLIHGQVRQGDRAIGEIVTVEYEPESASHVAVEVRVGMLGNPPEETRLANEVAAHLARQAPGSAPPAPARPGWSGAALSGRWFDLEEAVARSGVSKKSVDLAVVSVDRWRFATFWTLRSLGGEEARLIVLGDRQDAAGPRMAYLRLGLFGDPPKERTILKRLQDHLSTLGRIERPKETR